MTSYLSTTPNKLAMKIYRISNKFSKKGYYKMASFFQRLNLMINAIDLHHGSTIGNNVLILHSTGVVIGKNVVIGDNVKIYSGVVLGVKNPGTGKQPKIGNNVILSTGSKVLGSIIIGDNSVIGANAVVLNDVPKNNLSVGIPSKNIERKDV